MGEYAKHNGEEIKIGTCESMYYLRADQRHMVQHIPGNVNVQGNDAYSLHFRFRWPDEDRIAPGSHDPFERSVQVYGYTAPKDIEHGSVQFSNHAGYLCSLPCPEGSGPHPVQVHRNGWKGAVLLRSEKLLKDGRLVPILSCGGCGSMWRVEEPAEIEAIAVAFRSEADRRERQGAFHGTGKADRRFFDQIADRILEGAKLLATDAESSA